jgi:hypothetical protein
MHTSCITAIVVQSSIIISVMHKKIDLTQKTYNTCWTYVTKMLMTSRTCVQVTLVQQLHKIQLQKKLCTQNNCTLFATCNYTMHMYILHNQGPKTSWKKKTFKHKLKEL